MEDATRHCSDGGEPVDLICTIGDAGNEICVCPEVYSDAGYGGAYDGWDGCDIPDCDFGTTPDPVVTVAWDDSRLVLTIVESAEDGPYLFGIAETGQGAEGWYGEDCIDGVSNGADVCHDVPENGELILTHVTTIAEVGDTTTLVDAGLADGLTYVLIRDTAENQGCWTWGHDPGFYKDPLLGCNEITALAP